MNNIIERDFDRDRVELRCDNKKCIRDVVKKIDQHQKEACMQSQLEGCDAPLVGYFNDTKPVTFYLCNGEAFKAKIDPRALTQKVKEEHAKQENIANKHDWKTDLFRIEELRGNCVVLRLLIDWYGCVYCTEQTVVLDLCCVCAIQCFNPINCYLC